MTPGMAGRTLAAALAVAAWTTTASGQASGGVQGKVTVTGGTADTVNLARKNKKPYLLSYVVHIIVNIDLVPFESEKTGECVADEAIS